MTASTRPLVERTQVGGQVSSWILPAGVSRCPGRTGICAGKLSPEIDDGIRQWVCPAGHRWFEPGFDPLGLPNWREKDLRP